MQDDIFSYREMCDLENVQTLQRGMNYRLNQNYSVILMSQRSNAPYKDKIYPDGITIEYEGHDVLKRDYGHNPKLEDQLDKLTSGRFTQNGLFIDAIRHYKANHKKPELVKVYEKVMNGVWSLKGYFELIDYKIVNDGNRKVFRFILQLSNIQDAGKNEAIIELEHSRLIPSLVKKEVWKRDGGKCVLCGDSNNCAYARRLLGSLGKN